MLCGDPLMKLVMPDNCQPSRIWRAKPVFQSLLARGTSHVAGLAHGSRNARISRLLLADVEPSATTLDHHAARQADGGSEATHAIGVAEDDSGFHQAIEVRRVFGFCDAWSTAGAPAAARNARREIAEWAGM